MFPVRSMFFQKKKKERGMFILGLILGFLLFFSKAQEKILKVFSSSFIAYPVLWSEKTQQRREWSRCSSENKRRHQTKHFPFCQNPLTCGV